jgi:hypothetical protein
MRGLGSFGRVELVTRKVVKKVSRKLDYPLSHDARASELRDGDLSWKSIADKTVDVYASVRKMRLISAVP